MQTETVLATHFRNTLNKVAPGVHYFKIPNAFKNSLIALPYDAYFLYQGEMTAIEYKVNRNPVKAHQSSNLAEVIHNGGKSFVIRLIEAERLIIVENLNSGEILEFKESRWRAEGGIYLAVVKYVISCRASALDKEVLKEIKRNLITD